MANGRIRSQRPEHLHDPAIATLPDDARLLLLCLPSLADDHGLLPAEPGFLLGNVFWGVPRAADQVQRARDLLAERGLITLYRARGAVYARITGWDDDSSPMRQRIEKRGDAKHPTPEGAEVLTGSAKSSTRRRRRVAERSTNDRGAVGDASALDQDLGSDQEQEQEGEGRGKRSGSTAGAGAPADELREPTPHEAVRVFWVERYRARYSREHSWTAKEGAHVKALLEMAKSDVDEIKSRIANALEHPNPFPPHPIDLGAFRANWNKFSIAPAQAKANGAARATADRTGYGSDL